MDELSEAGENPVSQAKLVGHLEASKAAVSYRVRRLVRLGYLANLEEQRGRPYKLVPGAPLPERVPPLPEPCVLAQHLLDSGQEDLIQVWVDPVSGEHVNAGPSAPPSSPSEMFIAGVNSSERPNGPGPDSADQQQDEVQPFRGVQAKYEQSADGDDKPRSDDRSGVQGITEAVEEVKEDVIEL